MQIDTATGLLMGARQVLSPNFDARPAGVLPELIVVHGISLPPGEFGGPWIDLMFAGKLPPEQHPFFHDLAAARLSAHALIRRDGTITQYVPFGQRAWHAGQSHYRGRTACNDFSIGIELEGADGVPYTDPQYDQLAALVEALLAAYPSLSAEHIVGHCDIAPGRKSDPWASFDWERWKAILRAHGRLERRRR
ncbi:MAG TPA: 1,6-anhydro-N-acetylmuramyl-L-alanine amidase AmpD [Steroidobacteraceae bacterium]|nr:1,6-anhydro-N-acetylmuramyl-L-alanine amidase AmpD [Steroidobacteraceae bacterium]